MSSEATNVTLLTFSKEKEKGRLKGKKERDQSHDY
jgi:hypothetical protein